MANTFRSSSGTLHEPRSDPSDDFASPRASSPEPLFDHPGEHDSGPRKLVRPRLPADAVRRGTGIRGESTMLTHQAAQQGALAGPEAEDAHAEAFYFQKQIQTQTLMVFVLEDGEEIEGYIEWFDRNSIKVRNSRKTLIYKSSIKYLYKAGEGYGG